MCMCYIFQFYKVVAGWLYHATLLSLYLKVLPFVANYSWSLNNSLRPQYLYDVVEHTNCLLGSPFFLFSLIMQYMNTKSSFNLDHVLTGERIIVGNADHTQLEVLRASSSRFYFYWMPESSVSIFLSFQFSLSYLKEWIVKTISCRSFMVE